MFCLNKNSIFLSMRILRAKTETNPESPAIASCAVTDNPNLFPILKFVNSNRKTVIIHIYFEYFPIWENSLE